MPIHVYMASGETHCDDCREGFERLQKLDAEALSSCPRCSAPIKRKISAPHLASSAPSLKEGNLEKHGFTQYKKLEKGVYEKTAGSGPDLISDKDR